MAICYIVGAAPHCELFCPAAGDLVIAADGGQAALARMGVTPDVVVGDFDSSDAPTGSIRYPKEKDDTDTALALLLGEERGFRTFALYGCTGGRPDHSFGVVQTMLAAAKRKNRVYLVGEGMIGTVICNESFTFKANGYVSVFALSENACGVSLAGLKYPLEDATLTNDYPLGVSNEGHGDATVSVASGALYLLWEGSALPENARAD